MSHIINENSIERSLTFILSVQRCLCLLRQMPRLRSTSISRFKVSLTYLQGSICNKDCFQPCYLYECITPLRALMLQKTAPSKWKVRKYNPRNASVIVWHKKASKRNNANVADLDEDGVPYW